MGKHKKRKRGPSDSPSMTVAVSAGSSTPSAPLASSIELSASAVATTIATLRYIASRPDVLASKALRELRAALHPIVEAQLKRYDPIDYVARTTTALRSGHGADALLALQGLKARGQSVRQGTIQRWVRDCDSIADQGLRVRVLHAVLRAGKPLDESAEGCGAEGDGVEGDGVEGVGVEVGGVDNDCAVGDGDEAEEESADRMKDLEEVKDADEADKGDEADEAEDAGEVEEDAGEALGAPAASGQQAVTVLPAWFPHDSQSDATAATAAANRPQPLPEPSRLDTAVLGVHVVLTERGGERQPPNHHDLKIYACHSTLRILDESSPPTRRVDVPGVPGAFVLLDVLSYAECATLTSIAQTMGYTPDHPLSRLAASGIEALEWLQHTHVIDRLHSRCAPHLPAVLSGGTLAGINARWRFFRYTDADGAVYRPHIDGSWPGSGIDPRSGRYRHDAFGDRRSRLTFLMYLNDGFEGGCTTFYLPGTDGGLNARGVQPRAGSVLCFPQGNTASLLHEGSAVIRGHKDVIRTDVLYALPAAR
mmetsp:Transcript_40654/g.81531  ORF Transcript_40654/g.81531 Transcript_40654/m.81531 type:complete len:537 (-) Transcript_40654:271-1881(-)